MNRSRASISTASTAPSLSAFCRTASSASCEPSPATMSDSPRFAVMATTSGPASMNCLSKTDVSSPPEYASTIFTRSAFRPTHVFEALSDHRRLLRRLDDHEHGVVAADRAEDLRPVGAVERSREHHRGAGMRAQHDLIQAGTHLDHDLRHHAVQPRRECRPDARLDVLERAAVAAFERDLEQAELLDVARDRRLRDLVALLLEQRGELVLRVDRARGDEREDRALAFGFRLLVKRIHHSVSPRRSVRRARSSAFCACSRFSAWSNTMLRGPSITSEVTSSPRCAGRQCMNSTCFAAFASSSPLT